MDLPELRRAALGALRPGGWPHRRAIVRDCLLALVVLVFVVADVLMWWAEGRVTTSGGAFLSVAGIMAAGLVIIALTRLYPLVAVLAGLLGGQWSFALNLLLTCAAYLLGRRVPSVWPAVTTFTAGLVGWLLIVVFLWPADMNMWSATFFTAIFNLLLPWLFGVYRRQQVALAESGWEHARQLQREQRLNADQARLRERSRIAQDMHDSLGHELSLLALRAGALEVAPDLTDEHRRAATELRTSASNATGQLREIIGVLRTDTEPASRFPADEDVVGLVERARNSGMRIMLVREGPTTDLPPMVERAVHRVVQESITNAAKYAPDAEITVWVVAGEEHLEVRVTNAVPAGELPEASEGGRRGLIGLRERVRLAGGSFAAGPAHGGWEVCATMPLKEVGVPGPETDEEVAQIEHMRSAAGRRLRGWMLALVVVPLICALGLVGLIMGITAAQYREQALPREDLARISVGDSREEVAELLPESTVRLTPEPMANHYREPEGAECGYYRSNDRLFGQDTLIYQVCFRDGHVVYAGEAATP